MNGCDSCKVPVDKTMTIDPEWACCYSCGKDIKSLFPRRSTHEGRVENGLFHFWRHKEESTCPHCGQKSIGIHLYCREGGGSLEMPLFIELPEEILDETPK